MLYNLYWITATPNKFGNALSVWYSVLLQTSLLHFYVSLRLISFLLPLLIQGVHCSACLQWQKSKSSPRWPGGISGRWQCKICGMVFLIANLFCSIGSLFFFFSSLLAYIILTQCRLWNYLNKETKVSDPPFDSSNHQTGVTSGRSDILVILDL